MREAVRSGRRANFYITENSFIDHYAREVGTTGVAVYHVLERHANCETRSTWIGTAKMAELLDLDQRTIQRTIKKLESLRLIRIVRSANLTTFYIVPVPPRTRTSSTPLFDEMLGPVQHEDDADVAGTTPMSRDATFLSPNTTSVSQRATPMSQGNDIPVAAYKEEQNLSNKTSEQDFFYKTFENTGAEIHEAANRILNILRLQDTFKHAAIAAIELELRESEQSIDAVVTKVWQKATNADHNHVPRGKFIEDYLGKRLAEIVVDQTNLPHTNNLILTVTAALKAEAKDLGLSLEETAARITTAAGEDRRKGMAIDRFYFENCKWRSNGGVSKAERRKLDNLEVNARVKQRLRERLGAS